MRKMKDSGIEWIGKIPDIWRQTKLKYVTKIRSENGMYSPEQDSYIGLENIVSRSNKLIETETIYESALYSICKKGDILFNKLRPYLAKAIISPIDGFCTGELLNIKHFDGEKRFLWYYLLSDKFIEVVNASTYGAKMPRANTDFILNLPVFLPPLPEQKKIADFLDEKCGEIDSIRSDIQKQIDILNDYKKSVIIEAVTKGLNPKVKLKDSGIEWIGKIPEGWEVKPNKRIMKKIKQIKSKYEGEPILSLTMNGVVVRDLDNLVGKRPASFDGYQIIKPGNLLMCLFDIDVTPRCIGLIKNKGLTSPAYSHFALENIAYAPYYYYYYLFLDMTKELLHLAKNLRHSLTEDDLGAIKTVIPPLSEQKAIADYLDEKCSEIDATI